MKSEFRYPISVYVLFLLFFSFCSASLLAHGDEVHSEENLEKQAKEEPSEKLQNTYSMIDKAYEDSVKPIFKNKCFDCHSDSPNYPWYYSIPGAKQLIDHDIDEGREHIDFTNGFPFDGHGEPDEDLEELEEIMEENEMPPWQYKLLHWGSRLTENDKKVIKIWIEQSRQRLKSLGGENSDD